jgi:hypothetical protein
MEFDDVVLCRCGCGYPADRQDGRRRLYAFGHDGNSSGMLCWCGCGRVTTRCDRNRGPGPAANLSSERLREGSRAKVLHRLYQRQGGLCAYCGRLMTWPSDGALRAGRHHPEVREVLSRRITLDHVVPSVRGGAHVEANFVAACHPCNSAKCDRPWLPMGVS